MEIDKDMESMSETPQGIEIQEAPCSEAVAELAALKGELAEIAAQMKELLAEICKESAKESRKKQGFKVGTDVESKRETHSAISRIFGNA